MPLFLQTQWQRFDVGLNDDEPSGVKSGQLLDNFQCRTFPQVIDIWLEGQTKTGNRHVFSGFSGFAFRKLPNPAALCLTPSVTCHR
jgi:hypothetical protein